MVTFIEYEPTKRTVVFEVNNFWQLWIGFLWFFVCGYPLNKYEVSITVQIIIAVMTHFPYYYLSNISMT
jgi:hypothetical protein